MDNKKLNACVVRVKAGDNEAFLRLYEETKRGVFSFAYSVTGDYHTAEDVMQETYLRVKLRIGSYKDGTNFSAWLLQITKNLSYDIVAKRKRESTTEFGRDAGTYEIEEDRPMIRAVRRALDERQAQIVLLHAVSGFKHREIAQLLEMPLGTVTWSYKNSIKKLKKYLKEEEGL